MIVSSRLLGIVSKFALGKEFVLIAVAVLIISLLVSSHFNHRRLSFLPGLTPLPIIGNGHQIAPHINRFVEWLGELVEEYGGTTRFWIGNNGAVLTTDLDLIKQYYSSPQSNENFVPDTFRTIVGYMLGDGLITTTGKHWIFSRKTLAPTFTTTVMKNFIPVLIRQAEDLVEKLAAKSDGTPIPIIEDLTLTTFSTIAETQLQLKGDDLKNSEEVIAKMNIFMHLMQQRGFTPWQNNDKIYHLLPSGRLALKVKNYFHNYVEDVRQTAKQRLEERKLEGDDEWKKRIFINTLIENKGYTEQQVRDEIATILAAGSETSANALGFILLILGQHPDAQNKIYEEDLKILEEASGRELDNSDLQKYTYLDRVIKEALRLFPIVPLFYRKLAEDLQHGKYTIPAGTELLMPIFKIHRDPNTYQDPLKFDPDRFLPENVAKRHPFCFFPFGYGSRICLGWRFSTMSLKILVSTIIRNFKVVNDTPIDKLNLSMQITLKDINNVTVGLERR